MAVSKVILNGKTLIDVTVDTVTSENLLSGYQATRRDGQKVEGSYVPASVSLMAGSTNPSESAQHITPSSGYDGFSYFDVGAIDSNYIGSNIAQKSSTDLIASGSVVTVPSGYYSAQASKAVDAAAFATSLTLNAGPQLSLNSATGIITSTLNIGGQRNPIITSGYADKNTQVFVGASGTSTYALDTIAATTIIPIEDVQVAVASGKYTTGTINIAAIDSNYIGSNIAQKSSTDLSASGSVVTVPSGYYSAQATKAISAGSATTPAKTISVTPSISINSATGVITATAAGSSSITPTVSAGYVSNGTAGTVSVSGSNTSQLNTQAAATINPTEAEQTAVTAGKYTTGVVKVAAIPSDYIGSAIASVDIEEGVTTVSGTTAARGSATWSAGVIEAGSIPAATFANSSSAQTQYVDISSTTEAPVLVSGGYLYINKGYTDDLKISLAKLVPDGASADLASDKILSGYAAYNNDGTLIAGNIPTKTSASLVAAGSIVTVPSGYYAVDATKAISAGSATTPTTTISSNPTISIDTNGLITASYESSKSITPTVVTGYINSGTAGTVTASGLTTSQLSTQAATTITPTESAQTAVTSGRYTTGVVTIAAIPSTYIGSGIAQKSSIDLNFNNGTFTAPSGYYATDGIKVIATSSVSAPLITLTSSTGIITSTIAVSSAWYPSSSSSSSYQLITKSATTYTPSASTQSIPSGVYLTGVQTIEPIPIGVDNHRLILPDGLISV